MTVKQRHKAEDLVDKFVAEVARKLSDQDMSYAALADKTGLSRQYIYRILNGGQNLSMDVAQNIADVLGLKITVSDAS